MKVLLSVVVIVVEDGSGLLRRVLSIKMTDVSEMLKMSHGPDEVRNRL
jgi:hypothetical protein